MRHSTADFLAILALLPLILAAPAQAATIADVGHASVVKIHVTSQRENYAMPWQSGPQGSGSGTGYIIRNRRILTNAHMVADARFLEVQKNGDARRFRASVRFVAHDCDLAMLEVEEPSFFEDTRPLAFAERMPTLNDEVIVLGYPLGGDRLSATRGVVSRLDYSTYAHSGVDQHLVLQVDAAINPGNSGGPVLYNGRVVGLAFQGLSWAENIGYAIPLPVINHFLDDIADGRYHGYPELGVAVLGLRNPALRQDLGLPADRTGIVVYVVDPFGAAHDRLKTRDVLLTIDGRPIAEDGTVSLGHESFLFAELMERKQWGDTITMDVWRDGKPLSLTIPLDNPPDPFVFRNQYDRRAPYLIAGGLVFAPLSQELLMTLQRSSATLNVQQLFYTVDFAKLDHLFEGRDEFVVLIERLPHPVNAYLGDFLNGIVDEVNGIHIRNLRDLRDALQKPEGEYHRLRFVGVDDVLIMDVAAVRRAEPAILQTYNIPARTHLPEVAP